MFVEPKPIDGERCKAGVDRPLRVLHCPANVGAQAVCLARAERELGLDSTCLEFHPNPAGYEIDETLYAPGDGFLGRERKRWRLLRRVLREFDVVHFNFGRTLLPQCTPWSDPAVRKLPWWHRLLQTAYAATVEQRDLKWLREAGMGIVVTFQGDDARQGDVCRRTQRITFADEVPHGYYDDVGDRMKRRRIARWDAYADAIFALNPDLAHVLPPRTSFLPYAAVDVRQWQPVPARNPRPLVVHAPTHRDVKGTRFLEEAVRFLRAEGVDFDFQLVENVDRETARRMYERADLVVDQLLAGWYGALAVECMALGKPVVAYLRDEDLGAIPPAMRSSLPIVSAEPATIREVLRTLLVERREELPELGARSRRFVERWHDPLMVARTTRDAYLAAVDRQREATFERTARARRAA